MERQPAHRGCSPVRPLGIAALLLVIMPLAAGCAGSTSATAPPSASFPTSTDPAAATGAGRPAPAVASHRHHRSFRRSHASVPILMYHALGPPPPGEPYPLLYTSKTAFAAQLSALRAYGYHAVTLRRVWRAWHGWGSLPPRPVVITFDDGFGNTYRIGLPAMRRYHWPGDLFLLIDHLDQPGDWDLNARQVNGLVHAGWELDAHGFTEVDLPAVTRSVAWHDIHDSGAILRRRFHQPVRFFCYPVGAFDTSVVKMVRNAGYVGAVTTAGGVARAGSSPYMLPRIRVEGDESPSALIQGIRLAGG